jgi:hypothetical protein
MHPLLYIDCLPHNELSTTEIPAVVQSRSEKSRQIDRFVRWEKECLRHQSAGHLRGAHHLIISPLTWLSLEIHLDAASSRQLETPVQTVGDGSHKCGESLSTRSKNRHAHAKSKHKFISRANQLAALHASSFSALAVATD